MNLEDLVPKVITLTRSEVITAEGLAIYFKTSRARAQELIDLMVARGILVPIGLVGEEPAWFTEKV